MKERPETETPFSIRLCSDKAAFEVRLLRKVFLKMDDVRRLLENFGGHEVLVCTPHIMILRYRGAEITLSKDGRMLIKRIKDETEAALIAEDILRIAFNVTV